MKRFHAAAFAFQCAIGISAATSVYIFASHTRPIAALFQALLFGWCTAWARWEWQQVTAP